MGMEMKEAKWHNKCENEVEQTKRQEKRQNQTEPNQTKPFQCNAMKGTHETWRKFFCTHTKQHTLKISVDMRPTTISNIYEIFHFKCASFFWAIRSMWKYKASNFCFSFFFIVPIFPFSYCQFPIPIAFSLVCYNCLCLCIFLYMSLFLGIFPHFNGENLCIRNVCEAASEQCQMKIHGNANTTEPKK